MHAEHHACPVVFWRSFGGLRVLSCWSPAGLLVLLVVSAWWSPAGGAGAGARCQVPGARCQVLGSGCWANALALVLVLVVVVVVVVLGARVLVVGVMVVMVVLAVLLAVGVLVSWCSIPLWGSAVV